MHIYIFDEHGSSVRNGIGTFLRCLGKCLRDKADVTVLSFNDEVKIYKEETADGIRFCRFPLYSRGAFLDNTEPGLAVLRTMIVDSPANVFIVNHFICTRLLSNLQRDFPLSKRVFVIHDQLWTEMLNGEEKKLEPGADDNVSRIVKAEREMYALADAVVCLNANTRQLLHEVYDLPRQKVFLIPSGIDIGTDDHEVKAQARKALHIGKEEKLFLFVGRTTKFKGIRDTLAAFEQLVADYPEARLAVMGMVINLDEFTALCPTAISRVIFAGQVSPERLHQWYAAADYGIVPSYYEQLGFAGIEMMAHGLPVVASDGLGVRCMFRDGENAIVASIGDRTNPEEYRRNLARAMVRAVMMDSGQYASMSTNALECYKGHYTLGKMREGYARMLRNICRTKTTEMRPVRKRSISHCEQLYHLILHSNDMADIGLFRGKMGVALELASYAREKGVKSLENYVGYLLGIILNQLHKNMSVSFANGLCGIGWGVEYLVQNGFTKADTAEVCEEIDRKVMQCSPLRMTDLSQENGLEGMLAYINAHIKGNKGKAVFDSHFLAELAQAITDKSGQMSEPLKKQADTFRALMAGEDANIDMALTQFVRLPEGDFVNWNKLGLREGLAGLLCIGG